MVDNRTSHKQNVEEDILEVKNVQNEGNITAGMARIIDNIIRQRHVLRDAYKPRQWAMVKDGLP